MSNAPKYDERDIELRAKALDRFVDSNTKPIPPSKLPAAPPQRAPRWHVEKDQNTGEYWLRQGNSGPRVGPYPNLVAAETECEVRNGQRQR